MGCDSGGFAVSDPTGGGSKGNWILFYLQHQQVVYKTEEQEIV